MIQNEWKEELIQADSIGMEGSEVFYGVESLPEQLKEHLKPYDRCFSRPEQREGFRRYIAGLLSEAPKKNLQQMDQRGVEGAYQSLHHFLSEAPWEREELNQIRLDQIEDHPTMGGSEERWYVLDDTGQPRTFWSDRRGTDAVAPQWLGSLGKVDDGLVFVSTHCVGNDAHWPVDAQLYWPSRAREKLSEEERAAHQERSKLEIGEDLLGRIADRQPPLKRKVVVDNWYGGNSGFIKEIETQGYSYVAALNQSNKIFHSFPEDEGKPGHAAQEFLELLEASDFEEVEVERADGTSDSVHVACLRRPKLQGHGYVERLVIQVDDPHQPDPDEARYLITNEESLSAAEVVRVYAKRNWVEVFYREGKNQLGLDEAQVRREKGLLRHWTLVMVAYTLVQMHRTKSSPPGTRSTWKQTYGHLQKKMALSFWLEWVPRHFERFVSWLAKKHNLRINKPIRAPAGT